MHDTMQVSVTLASKETGAFIGTEDCAKVHRVLRSRLEALTGRQDINMEVMSPGMERLIRNAAEFALFTGRMVRVWDTDIRDWVPGIISASTETELLLEGDTPAQTCAIPYLRIAKAKLVSIDGLREGELRCHQTWQKQSAS
jgi:ribosome maturation factor RimP